MQHDQRAYLKLTGKIPFKRSQRSIVPVKRSTEPSVCVRWGNPEYPCSDNYAGRRDEEKPKDT